MRGLTGVEALGAVVAGRGGQHETSLVLYRECRPSPVGVDEDLALVHVGPADNRHVGGCGVKRRRGRRRLLLRILRLMLLRRRSI